jgi:DNA-binding FadR family transcriptional regulator
MLAGITENPIVILMHKVIVDLSTEFFENVEASVPMVKKTLDQHRQIVDLLKQSKFEEAGEVCFQHIVDVSSTIIEKSKQQSLIISRRI